MADARLEVNDGLGRRVVELDKATFTLGRRSENDIRLSGSDVSRDHAELVLVDGQWLVRDRASRYGTFVNDEQVVERVLVHGDRIQCGRASGTDIVFLLGSETSSGRSAPGVSDLRQLAALLEGLRALGSGRVLDEVLALVLDTALEVTKAERGFIMLAGENGVLDMKLARARGKVTLPGNRFDTSRKIPEEVFETGEVKIVADLLDGDLANVHMGTVALGIRHVACAPLRIVRYFDKAAELPSETKSIGVLYLDSREKGSLLAPTTRTSLDTLATEAGVAIENARLYRETLEKARIEHELKIAAEIQRALLPEGNHNGTFFEASGTSLQARTIGGDFFDLMDMTDGTFAFLVGDVSGKGPAAALLTSKIIGIFSALISSSDDPAVTMGRLNEVLTRRAIDARYATTMYGRLAPSGELHYCSAGHNPALVYGPSGLRRLDEAGVPVGLFPGVSYSPSCIQMHAGDILVLYSDGVTEAMNVADEEFGEERLVAVMKEHAGASAADVLDRLVEAVKAFALGAEQYDDVTALVVKFLG